MDAHQNVPSMCAHLNGLHSWSLYHTVHIWVVLLKGNKPKNTAKEMKSLKCSSAAKIQIELTFWLPLMRVSFQMFCQPPSCTKSNKSYFWEGMLKKGQNYWKKGYSIQLTLYGIANTRTGVQCVPLSIDADVTENSHRNLHASCNFFRNGRSVGVHSIVF